MKKLISILTAVTMLMLLVCAATADEVPQPEGGKKFEGNWAIPGGNVQIDYEEQGYRISIDILKKEDKAGSAWEYSCFYHEETDSLKSASSSRTDYTYDPDTGEQESGDPTYDGFDDEGQVTEFTIDQDGFLIWKDGHDDAGAGLKFTNIGTLDGTWKNEAEETEVEFQWKGYLWNDLEYGVFITRGKTDGDQYTLYTMNGKYDPASGKLDATGTCTLYTKNADGTYDEKPDNGIYNAVFSMTEEGKVLCETDSAIELEPEEE